eukprot:6721293-Pyramimonas_sp.AAC.1
MLANPKGVLRTNKESERILRTPKESYRILNESSTNPNGILKKTLRRPHAVPVRVRACAPQESLKCISAWES